MDPCVERGDRARPNGEFELKLTCEIPRADARTVHCGDAREIALELDAFNMRDPIDVVLLPEQRHTRCEVVNREAAVVCSGDDDHDSLLKLRGTEEVHRLPMGLYRVAPAAVVDVPPR